MGEDEDLEEDSMDELDECIVKVLRNVYILILHRKIANLIN